MTAQKWPKAYIIQRIEARIASLRRSVAEAQPTIDDYEGTAKETLREWTMHVRVLAQDIVTASALALKSNADVDALDSKTMSKNLDALENLRRQLDDMPRPAVAGRSMGYATPEPIRIAVRTIEGARAETATLEHALAYLRDTPIDEFTLTALRELHLLDIVRFTLRKDN